MHGPVGFLLLYWPNTGSLVFSTDTNISCSYLSLTLFDIYSGPDLSPLLYAIAVCNSGM